jgi:omega-3 fatty acid desaturase (delta-15 desaturase)
LSHRRHHLYHNHVEKDYSHPWYTEERLARPHEGLARTVNNNRLILFTFPLVGWQLYLYGFPDGSHYFPIESHRLWKDGTPSSEFSKCIFSTSVVATFLYFWFHICGGNVYDFLFYYFMPHCVFGWWIVTVTYLQHHSPGTLVYNDETWNYVLAAFETVDRTYGFGLDTLLHNITNGHVVHHLFFKSIPHYNLVLATESLKNYLQEHNLLHLYRHEETRSFVFLIFKYMIKYGLRGTESPPVSIKPPISDSGSGGNSVVNSTSATTKRRARNSASK